MAEMSSEQLAWIKTVLGFDTANAGGDAPGRKSQKRAKDGEDGLALAPPPVTSTPTPPPGGAPPTPAVPTDARLVAALKELTDEADALKALGFDTAQMLADGAAFSTSIVKAEQLTDDKARKAALDGIRKRVGQAVEHARALSKSMKSVMAGKTGSPDADEKSAIYKKAIEDLYGLKIKVPTGMANTHFDKVFDMFGSVPKEHVKQDKLKKLTYSDAAGDRGGGAYGSAEIEMGDFGAATGKEDYEIDGEVIPANSFNVTTLHEIGHAVDEKEGVMTKNQGKAGCGGWKSESVGSATAAFLAELKSSVTVSSAVTDPMLSKAIAAALNKGTTTQPDTIGDDDWKEILPFLVGKCLAVRSDADPWFASSQIVIGDRVYQEAYGGEWWSYTAGARASTKVNNYQWRSPAEWFAEVYAISWLAKKPPPTGVDAAIMPYMWKG